MSGVAAALAGSMVLDLAVGEPPNAIHPVAWFGRVVARLDRPWGHPRAVGVALAVALPLVAGGVVGGLVWGIATADGHAGVVAGALALFAAVSLRALLGTVRRVSRLADSDLPAARAELRALAGRDASALDVAGVRSAALESLAENLADGLVAPLAAAVAGVVLASLLELGVSGTLAVVCGGAAWIKAVNTMDSMVGYRDKPLGFGAAKTDDLAMWVPARVTAVLLAVWLLAPTALVRARSWAREVPSPNSGWPMGVLAAGLGVRLEKPGVYVLNPGGSVPTHAAARRALSRVGAAALSAYALAGVIAWY